MPPHNKKNKGKTGKRKDKLARESLKYQRLWLPLLEASNGSQGHCGHGVTEEDVPGIDHPVTLFINELFKWDSDTHILSQGVLCSSVWNDAVLEKLARKLLLAVGTQCLLQSSLQGDNRQQDMSAQAENVAMAIYALEIYERRSKDLTIEQRDDILVESMIDNQSTGSNVMDGNIRDLLKFYHKRLDCNCLKEKYKLARQVLPKIGKCCKCKTSFERHLLLRCSVCKSNGCLYCSPKCQRADYPRHKDDCLETLCNKHREPGFFALRNESHERNALEEAG